MPHPVPIAAALATLALAPQAALAAIDAATARAEADAILAAAERESGRMAYSPDRAIDFPEAYNVYLPSALAIDFTYRDASVKLPLYRGVAPDGSDAFYVLTEASDAAVAETLGIIHAPKLAVAADSEGAQPVSLEDGIMRFEGAVDFSPVREIAPGADRPFPPAAAVPGAVADEAWSSIVVLPSGVVLNAQVVANDTGIHDRAVAVNTTVYTATLSLLDGFADDRQYFYHLVTDVSADVPAALENGVYAPKLGLLPTFGVSGEESALLGFSPVLNGISDVTTGEDQGFEALLANGGIDPINVFPYGPGDPNYSPLWDAHVSQWTEAAVAAGEVRRITSFEDLAGLIEAGLVESAFINPEGAGNDWLYGLRPTRVVINCPVIAHPDPSVVVR